MRCCERAEELGATDFSSVRSVAASCSALHEFVRDEYFPTNCAARGCGLAPDAAVHQVFTPEQMQAEFTPQDLAKAQELGEFVKSASSTLEPPVVRKLKEAMPAKGGAEAAPAPAKKAPAKKAAPKTPKA